MCKYFIPGVQQPANHNIPGSSRRKKAKPSPWQYGAGAYHDKLVLPPITRSPTSIPTGSTEASHWPTSNTRRNPGSHG